MNPVAHRKPSPDAERLRRIRARLDHAPHDVQMAHSGGTFHLLSKSVLASDGMLASFTPEAPADWPSFFAEAPDDIVFLLALIDRATRRIRSIEASQAPSQPHTQRVDQQADYAAEAAMKCGHKAFGRFLIERCGLDQDAGDDAIAQALRDALKIRSRAELNAAGRWLQLRAEYGDWTRK